jgi:hypothetical protein
MTRQCEACGRTSVQFGPDRIDMCVDCSAIPRAGKIEHVSFPEVPDTFTLRAPEQDRTIRWEPLREYLPQPYARPERPRKPAPKPEQPAFDPTKIVKRKLRLDL